MIRRRLLIFSTGAILDEASEAVKLLEKKVGGVEQYSFPTVKPLDVEVIEKCANHLK